MGLTDQYFDDLEFEMMEKEFEIEMAESQREILDDSNLYLECVMFESENEEKKEGILNKMVTAIRNMIAKILDYIGRLFKSVGCNVGEKLSVSDYMNANSTKVKFDEDMEPVINQIEDEIMENHKIITAISNKLGKDPKDVMKYTDKAQEFIKTDGVKIMTVAATVVLANKISGLLFKTKENAKKADELAIKIHNLDKSYDKHISKTMKDDNHPYMAALNSVVSKCSRDSTFLGRQYVKLTNKISKFKYKK